MNKICYQLVFIVKYFKILIFYISDWKKFKYKTEKSLLTNICRRSVYAASNLRWQSGIIIRDSCRISAYNKNLCETGRNDRTYVFSLHLYKYLKWFRGIRKKIRICKTVQYFNLVFFIDCSERERERSIFVVPPIHTFIGWFLHVPQLGGSNLQPQHIQTPLQPTEPPSQDSIF